MNAAALIKSAISMEQALNRYGVERNRAGYLSCPFHTERTASCRVTPDGQHLHCFGCGANADVIEFTQVWFGLDFRGAVEKLDSDFGLGVTGKRSIRENAEARRKLRAAAEKRTAELKAREEAENAYHAALDRYCRADAALLREEIMSDAWCAALKDKAEAEYYLAAAEEGIRKANGNDCNRD